MYPSTPFNPLVAEWNTPHMDFTKTPIQTLIRHYDKLVRIETEKQDNKHKKQLRHLQMRKNMQPKRPSSEKPQLRG